MKSAHPLWNKRGVVLRLMTIPSADARFEFIKIGRARQIFLFGALLMVVDGVLDALEKINNG